MRFSAALTAAMLLCIPPCINADETYDQAIGRMLDSYPQSHLQDIYKSFFQDRFGPGHLLTDTVAARRYLHSEIEQMGHSPLPYYEPAGTGSCFYRVNLSVVKEGIVSEDEFFSIFAESAAAVTFPPIDQWQTEWSEILSHVPASVVSFERDRAMIDSVLAAGEYAIHHSPEFEQSYDPHYRLISKDVFERRLLPLLPDNGR